MTSSNIKYLLTASTVYVIKGSHRQRGHTDFRCLLMLSTAGMDYYTQEAQLPVLCQNTKLK